MFVVMQSGVTIMYKYYCESHNMRMKRKYHNIQWQKDTWLCEEGVYYSCLKAQKALTVKYMTPTISKVKVTVVSKVSR